MANFDPDKYLSESSKAETEFNPDAYLATTQDEVAKKKSTHFYIECGRWYIHIGIRTED